VASNNDIRIRLITELDDLRRGFNEVASVSKSTANRVESAFSGVSAQFAKLGLAINGFREAMHLIVAPIAGVVTASAKFETLQARLESLYGSADRAAEVFGRLKEVAATTPFAVDDIVAAGIALRSFGADAEKTIKPIADLAAFMGVNATEAAQAFGRAFAAGAGAADMLRERGVLALVASFKGIEDISKLTLPEFREALFDALVDPAAGVAGSTDRMAQTLTGAFSNLGDSAQQLSAALGDELRPALVEIIRFLTDLAAGAKNNLGPVVIGLKSLGAALAALAAGMLVYNLPGLIAGVTGAITALNAALLLNPFTALAAGLAGAAAAIALFSPKVSEGARLTGLFGEEAVRATEAANGFSDSMVYLGKQIGELVGGDLDLAVSQLTEIVEALRAGGVVEFEFNGATLQLGLNEAQALLDEYTQKREKRDEESEADQKKRLKRMSEFALERDTRLYSKQLELQDAAIKRAQALVAAGNAAAAAANTQRFENELAAFRDHYLQVESVVRTVTESIGVAFEAGFSGNSEGLKNALKAAVFSILDAVKAQLLAAKVAALAMSITTGGLSNLKNLPEILAAEAAFALLKSFIARSFAEGGLIDKPTLALLGESTTRSGKEIVTGEKTFTRWANEVLLPKVSRGSASDRLLVAVEARLASIERTLNPSKMGKAIGRELGTLARSNL